LSNQLMHITN